MARIELPKLNPVTPMSPTWNTPNPPMTKDSDDDVAEDSAGALTGNEKLRHGYRDQPEDDPRENPALVLSLPRSSLALYPQGGAKFKRPPPGCALYAAGISGLNLSVSFAGNGSAQ